MPAVRQLFVIVKRHVAKSSVISKTSWAPKRNRPPQVHFRPKTSSGHVQLSDISDESKDEKAGWEDLESRGSGSSRFKSMVPRAMGCTCSPNDCGRSAKDCGILQVAEEVKVVSTRVNPSRESGWLGESTYTCKIEGGAVVNRPKGSAQSSRSMP